MVVDDSNRVDLNQGAATGMGFYIIEGPTGFLAVYVDGAALPLYTDAQYYCVDDLLAGTPVPTQRRQAPPIIIQQRFPNRYSAIAALQAAAISPSYTGTAGAFPLVATYTLRVHTIFCRYLPSPNDPRFVANQLTAGTYLTSQADSAHADSGLGAVGRYALPIPLPASYVIEYELSQGTTIEVGTVAPNFGQSGGGVEIHLPNITTATHIGINNLPDY
jgi:hypothetical protein